MNRQERAANDPDNGYESDSSSISGRVWMGDRPVPDNINPAWACLSIWPLIPRRERDDDSASVVSIGGGVWVEG